MQPAVGSTHLVTWAIGCRRPVAPLHRSVGTAAGLPYAHPRSRRISCSFARWRRPTTRARRREAPRVAVASNTDSAAPARPGQWRVRHRLCGGTDWAYQHGGQREWRLLADGANGSVRTCPLSGCPDGGPLELAAGQAQPTSLHVVGGFAYWLNRSVPGATHANSIMRISAPPSPERR